MSSPNSASVSKPSEEPLLYTYCGNRSLEKDLIDLPNPEKFKCIRDFWAVRQDTDYFSFRHMRELPANACSAMKRIFEGSGPEKKLDVKVERVKSGGKNKFVCGYWWPALDKHIKGIGELRDLRAVLLLLTMQTKYLLTLFL